MRPTLSLNRGVDDLEEGVSFIVGMAGVDTKPKAWQLGASFIANLKVKYQNSMKSLGQGADSHPERSYMAAWQPGELELVDHYNEILWTGKFSVGTPPVNLDLVFDTGSSDTWALPGVYYATRSQTANPTGRKFSVNYGDGSEASGDIYKETISVASVTSYNVPFGSATMSTMIDRGNQGIAGMAFEKIAKFKAPPFYQTMFDQKAIQKNIFGVGLWSVGARLDLGHIQAKYSSKIAYSPVDSSKGWWMTPFNISGLPDTQTGIIDTGTTLIIGPKHLVRTVLAAAGCEVIEKNNQIWGQYATTSSPRITFSFGGKPYTLSKEGLSFQDDAGGKTWAGIIGANMGTGLNWIIGGCFLQDVYAVFDAEAMQVGFAPK